MMKNQIKASAVVAALALASNSYAQQAPVPQAWHVAGDFERLAKDINAEVSIVDQEGVVREGILKTVTGDEVSVQFGSITKQFGRAEVASVARLKDRTLDGAIKGAVLAAVMGLLVVQGYPPGSDRAGMFAWNLAIWTGTGWLIDAAQTHHQTIYRAPGAAAPGPSTPAAKLSFRF